MLKLRAHTILALFGILGAIGLLSATVASGTCGGEEESVSMSVSPTVLKFTAFKQKKEFTIKNTGSVNFSIDDFLTGGFAYTSEACIKKVYKPGESCTVTVECTGFPAGKYVGEYPIITLKASGAMAEMKLECVY